MVPILKYAKLSSVALSASLKIDKGKSRQYIAQALGYETWGSYVKKANSCPPDLTDDSLSPDIANHRLGVFTQNLMDVLQLDEQRTSELAKSISPFTGIKPKAYRVDVSSNDDKDSINLSPLFDSAGGKDGMLDFIHQMAESHPELAMLKDIDNSDDFMNRMRISTPMDPAVFYDFLQNFMPWELDDSMYEEEYTYLEESFHIESSIDGVSYPVFIVSLCGVPGDSNDSLMDEIKDIIGSYGGRALVLFRMPAFKEIKGVTYAVIGSFFNGKDWSWTLLVDEDPEIQAKSVLASNFDLESPVLGKRYEVMDIDGCPGHIVYQSFVNGGLDTETGKLSIPNKASSVAGIGGWESYIF